MAMRVNGITYHLADDCDTLLCKLDNADDEAIKRLQKKLGAMLLPR